MGNDDLADLKRQIAEVKAETETLRDLMIEMRRLMPPVVRVGDDRYQERDSIVTFSNDQRRLLAIWLDRWNVTMVEERQRGHRTRWTDSRLTRVSVVLGIILTVLIIVTNVYGLVHGFSHPLDSKP